MKTTLRRLANTSAALPLTVSQASTQLIPPIPLYRKLLRAHRQLPEEMRFMGDSYVKSEFRLTRSTDNPLHIIGFLSQWKLYLDQMVSAQSEAQGEKIDWNGRKLDMEAFEKMSNEQVGQLYELMHATKGLWKSSEQIVADAQAAEIDGDTPTNQTDKS